VFATVGRGGWSVSFVSAGYGGIDHLSRLEGYGRIDEPMLQACIMLGVPVCDTTTIPDDDIILTLYFPMPAHPDSTILGDPDNYGMLDYAPFTTWFRLCQKIGATLYNMPTEGD
jgi:hypothetical protein